jgi:N-acyl-D-amino-acid deacylase
VSGSLLLRGGRVVDGTGAPWIRADVLVRDGRIAAVGHVDAEAETTLDVDGLTIAPGFIDMHTHSDLVPLYDRAHASKAQQGVTLEVIGQDGLSLAPATPEVERELADGLAGWNGAPDLERGWRSVADYLARFDAGVATNVAFLVGHGTLRLLAMGGEDRAPTAAELAEMQRLLRAALADGAFGLSAGLTYAPGMYADDDEIVALCAAMAGTGAFYCPHHRSYGRGAVEAYAAAIACAERAGVPIHLAHTHLGFTINEGRGAELLGIIDGARARGVDVTFDTYPYLAGNTYLHSILPGWSLADGTDATIARLRDPDLRERLRVDLEETGTDGFHAVPVDWSWIVVGGTGDEANAWAVGRSIADLAAERGERPIDLFCELAAADRLMATALHHIGNEEHVRMFMQHPAHTAGSDGILVGSRPHPRGWGTMPRYLAHYVRELGVLRLEEAVRHMTSAPAQRLGLLDRGIVRPGMVADLVAFDADAIRDTATYEDPRQAPEGIPHVWVAGVPTVLGGRRTEHAPGRALRSPFGA